MTTLAQKEALQSNCIFPCDIWKVTAKDGAIAAYASHTRKITFESQLYLATPAEPTRSVISIGLEPDTAELAGVFDDTLTRSDLEGGRWKGAEIVKEILIDYRDPTIGSARKQRGWAGQFHIQGHKFTLEFRSLADRMNQTIGDLTSSVDRRRRLDGLGINIAAFTHAGAVMNVTDRRKFKIDYVQPSANYFRYGLVKFLTGANATLEMEIKSSTTTDSGTRTEIELQKPMRSVVAIGDTASFYRGYNGTRAGAKALGVDVVESAQAEWEIPPLGFALTYPQS